MRDTGSLVPKDSDEAPLPPVPDMDASGTVEAVGRARAPVGGDEVFGSVGKGHLGEGTLAELASMSVGTIACKPSTIEHATAAAIPAAGVAALNMADALAEAGDALAAVATHHVRGKIVVTVS